MKNPTDYSRAFGARLRHLREDAGLTHQELADAIGCAKARVSEWETGKRLPLLETAERMVVALKLGTLAVFDGLRK